MTIRNVRVTATASGPGSAAISGNQPGLKVINSTVRGSGPGSSTVEAAIRDYPGLTVEGSNLTLCSDCVEGWPLMMKITYSKVSSIYPGAHAENIYFCSGTVNVDHSTLLNEQGQTAVVFGDTPPRRRRATVTTCCMSGGGSNGYFPGGGGYGLGAYFSGALTWSGNVWDDSGATIPSP